MNSKDLCEILEASKGTGIKEIKLKDVVLKFDNLTIEAKPNNNSTTIVPYDTSSQTQTVEDVNIYGESEGSGEDNKDVIDEFVAAHLMADDPEAYEKYLKGN